MSKLSEIRRQLLEIKINKIESKNSIGKPSPRNKYFERNLKLNNTLKN